MGSSRYRRARLLNPVNLLADLEEFIHDHRPHGPLSGDATEPAWNGYLLTVACPCGVTFARWVTPKDAAVDLLHQSARPDHPAVGADPGGPGDSVARAPVLVQAGDAGARPGIRLDSRQPSSTEVPMRLDRARGRSRSQSRLGRSSRRRSKPHRSAARAWCSAARETPEEP